MALPDRLDPTSPTIRYIIVRFDIEDDQDRVEVDIGKLHPRLALSMLMKATDLLDGVDDNLSTGVVIQGDKILDADSYVDED